LRPWASTSKDDSALDPRLTSSVCRPDERPQQAEFAELGIDHAKLCFVAKEAVFNAVFSRQRTPVQFEQLSGIGRFLCDPGVMMAAFLIRHRA